MAADRMRNDDLSRALALASEGTARERWSRDQLLTYQQGRLRELLAHAAGHSPFYRDLSPATTLQELPVLTKAEAMSRWDDIVTDRRLSLRTAREHLDRLRGDDYFGDEFRILSTGGSSRIPGIFAFGREDWAHVAALMFRALQRMEALSAAPRDRLAVVGPVGAWNTMTSRLAATLALADPHPEDTLRLDISRPLPELVAELEEFRPARLVGYPSIVAMLAAEQLDGRLSIAPRHVTTSSEPQTSSMRARIEAAWGTTPHDIWAITEASGVLSSTCPCHRGLHLAEDACIVEVVDDDLRPVPVGELGSKILVTNLVYRTLPLIRYLVDDCVAVSPDACECGRTTRLIGAVEGRSDDVLRLCAAVGGETVALHPRVWSPLAGHPSIAEFRVIHEPTVLRVDVVLRDAGRLDEVERLVGDLLAAHGVSSEQPVEVHAHDHLPRSGQGKLKLVESRHQRVQAEEAR